MSLYEISSELQSVIEGGMVFDVETGEVIFDSDSLDELQALYDDKLEGCGLYVKNQMAEIEAIKAEEKRLAERRRVKERKAERMKEYMLQSMERTGTSKLDTAKIAISTRKSKRVIVDDQSILPRNFVTIEQTEKVDKAALKKALASGDVAGAHIEENVNLQLK